MSKFVTIAHPDMVELLRNEIGFVPAARYGGMLPAAGEIGSMRGVRYIQSASETTEFLTTEEFVEWSRHPQFVRESAIQGRIFNTVYISLVPPEAV